LYVLYKNIGYTAASANKFSIRIHNGTNYTYNSDLNNRYPVPDSSETKMSRGIKFSEFGGEKGETYSLSIIADWELRVTEENNNNNTYNGTIKLGEEIIEDSNPEEEPEMFFENIFDESGDNIDLNQQTVDTPTNTEVDIKASDNTQDNSKVRSFENVHLKDNDVVGPVSLEEIEKLVREKFNSLDLERISENDETILFSGESRKKLFGFIPIDFKFTAEINKNDMTIKKVKKPFWSFLAF
jgi:hypothetical protein